MAVAFYEKQPSAEDLARFGWTAEDFEDQIVEIWPETMPAFCMLRAMQTQWRVGQAGPIGLDYSALPAVWKTVRLPDGSKIPKDERPSVFLDLQVMEIEALNELRKKQ